MREKKISSKGFNFQNEPLTENNLAASVSVMWRNKIYKTGNRRHTSVELLQSDKFIRTASMKSICLVK